MSDGAGRNVAFTLIGVALVGTLAYFVWKAISSGEEEERPPIIVKGGSLIIQSGVDASTPGKPWFEDADGEWKQFHPAGQPTNVFRLIFDSSSGCNPQHTLDFIVAFDPDGGGTSPEVQFTISAKPRNPGGGGTPGPAVDGAHLDNSNKRPTPRLTYTSSGDWKMRVLKRNGNEICGNVKELRAEPLQ